MCVSAFLPQIYNKKKKKKKSKHRPLLVFFLTAVSKELCPVSEAAKEKGKKGKETNKAKYKISNMTSICVPQTFPIQALLQ